MIGEVLARVRSVYHGHISTLHIWWARKPLAASRATAYAALTLASKDAERLSNSPTIAADSQSARFTPMT
jgi:adenine-specific DNA methylase